MDKNEGAGKTAPLENTSKESIAKGKGKNRGKKRKRRNSESSSEYEAILPDNSVDVDRSLHASAIKNNLDETSVRKIIKKVVTNDRVLALVKMREEEDSGPEENSLRPKLTRSKVKELMKVSPKTGAWNLENLELTPIKHIPVKTRPEVKALIAQELPEDEDDEEYEPTHDDVPSDDDQGLESCSDLDSQPRTPATPRSQHSISPKVVKDGPFKVPQDISTPTRRKLNLEEEATIALRTRSKLSLSATSIEHIESTFIPPDDIPPAVDDLWNQFLNECLNPASTSKNEDDDETDPEYNVAADPDAHDEDEEALGNSIIKISKKELNDLVTELFNIMPESTAEEELMANNLANSVLTDHSQTEVSTRWEGKQEPLSDDESGNRKRLPDRITFEKNNYSKVSIGKMEPPDPEDPSVNETPARGGTDANKNKHKLPEIRQKPPPSVRVSVVEREAPVPRDAPPLLQRNLPPAVRTECVHIQVNQTTRCVLPEQVQILQQQLRQHIQLATSSYLQLYVHPIHWSYACKFKEYLETFSKLVDSNPKSVANVCNLKPAVELVTTWENTVSANTPENRAMIEFIQKESDRCSRRSANKNLYLGEFHDTFKKVVANSPVFLYPYLLPSMPFRGDCPKRYCYLQSEDELIALGLEQFWKYVTDNPTLYKPVPHLRQSWGLGQTVQLIVKHMFPWLPFKLLHCHILHARKDKDNPICKYFKNRTVTPVQHKLLPYNPQLTLYEQPEHEVPRLWVRYLAKTSKRFKSYLLKRTSRTGVPPRGIDIEVGQTATPPAKIPLPIQFTNRIVTTQPIPTPIDKFDIQITSQSPIVSNFYRFVETSTGAYLLPYTMTVNSSSGPITTAAEINSIIANNLPENSITKEVNKNIDIDNSHCSCCVALRKIRKQRQTSIKDYFGNKRGKMCDCGEKRYPRVSIRLRMLVDNFKNRYTSSLHTLQSRLERLKAKGDKRLNETDSDIKNNVLDDIVYVTSFHLKYLTSTSMACSAFTKRKIYNLLSKFNPDVDDPLQLASNMQKTLGDEFVDLYKEFVGFLTPEQADKLDAFRDYFIRNCVIDLVKKVEELVSNEENRQQILEEVHRVFSKNLSTACEICTDLLATVHEYPALAVYVHSLFPHRRDKTVEQKNITPAVFQESSQLSENPVDETMGNDTTFMEEATADYEADQSMSEEENNDGNKSNSESESTQDGGRTIKTETPTIEDESTTCASAPSGLVITVSKTEFHESSESSNSSLKIMFEDEMVKLEIPEWKRDEDKLVLEVLKQQLTPEERQDKTILEIIDEKDIVGMISQSLTDKTENDIRSRILYLLQIC